MSNFWIFLVIFLGLAFLRVPIPFSMGISAIIVYMAAGGTSAAISMKVFGALNVFTFLAIPAFIFAGDLMAASGISSAIMRFANAFIGRLRGAAGAVTILTCMLFGAITGSSLATITGIGGMAGGVGSMLMQFGAGLLFVHADETHMTFMGFEGKPAGYFIMFCICAVAYLVGWVIMKALVPKYKPIVLD